MVDVESRPESSPPAPDRTTRSAALWATLVAVPVAFVVGLLIFTQVLPRAETAAPEAWQVRVARLLDVPAGARDDGQPAQLALGNTPSLEQLAGEASASVDAELEPVAVAENTVSELSALEEVDPSSVESANFQSAFTQPAPAPVMASAPVRQDASRFAQPQAAPIAPSAAGTHLVQLGSFSSEQGARRAWNIYTQRYPELAGHQMVISEAVVKGKRYWRVSAAGFSRTTSTAMCGRVRGSGQGCIAYAEGRPLPGAVDSGVRMARRD